MNELRLFESQEFGKIRVVEINGEPWFVGKDVAQALGYGEGKSLANAVANHVDEEDKGVTELMTPGGKQKMVIINESGLYSLVLSSKLPSAKKFKRWVTSEVLPSIRKNGGYSTIESITEYQKTLLSVQEKNAHIQTATLLNQIAADYTGTYHQILQAYAIKELVGEFALPLPTAERPTHTAGEIGKKLGISANKVGALANKYGLKTPEYGAWFVDKSPYSSKEVRTFRYFDNVVPVLQELLQS